MFDFKNYIWQGMRKGIIQLWLTLVLLSALSYSGVIVVLKNRELASGLKVAAFTVSEALKAGDWPLAIGHLGALEAAGPVFDITLNRISGSNITGPFGRPAWGLGSICQKSAAGSEMTVGGCVRIFGPSEVTTILIFLLFASLLFFVVFRFFRERMLFFIGRVSDEIKDMSSPNVETQRPDITELNEVREFIIELLKERERSAEAIALSKLSAQVAHDIRSPLTALDSVLTDVSQIAEEKRILLRRSISRIRDIANNLLEKNRTAKDTSQLNEERTTSRLEVQMLSSHIEALVSEKRAQYSSQEKLDIDFSQGQQAYKAFAKINSSDFKRILSNIIDNSAEAVQGQGAIAVCLEIQNSEVVVRINDDGPGIPKDVLPLLTTEGFSYKKMGGSGLGLFHARTTIESWGGKIAISSQENIGTSVEICLPKASPPHWYVSKIEIPPSAEVVILDDDETVHLVWENRIKGITAESRPRLDHFYDTQSFIRWWSEHKTDKTALFLFDHELIGSEKTGLDLIEEFALESQAILVTSHSDDKNIVSKCVRGGIKLLPKGMANYVPIEINEPNYSAVLIDDDEIVRMNWEAAASEAGTRFKSFKSPNAFLSWADHIPKSASVFIDSNLGDGQKGELVAETIHEMGFNDIKLTTGYAPDDFSEIPWINEVVGKEPPWAASTANGEVV